ncbi:MAG: alpha/beta fold hydrolase [Thermoanaerobaculales bacterium]|nr:alpha/beta fold hydrolase [Thermoanaerobaculales bacterium]
MSAFNACFGDSLSKADNELQQPMAFYRDNHPVAPEDFEAPPTGKVCVLVHGLGCNESLWNFPKRYEGGSYGELLERRCGYMPLYLRFNSGLRISDNGEWLAGLLERFCVRHDTTVSELLLIGHSMGGLVIRSACHLACEAGRNWVSRVRHVIYLGSPHLGAPLEKATNVATHVLGLFDTTATRVIRDVLNARSVGVKDLRFGNLVDQDWLDCDPDELMKNRRVPIPWPADMRHHRVVGQALPTVGTLGDTVVRPESAAGRAHGAQPGAPGGSDVRVMPGLDHMALARHPGVFEHIERWVTEDG